MMQATPVVFIVDDDVSVRRSLALLIESAGWHSQTFGAANEFLSCPKAHAPSCLVLDMNLPDIDGLELQKRVLLDRIHVPIIFISAYGDVPMTVQAMKAGAIEFLVKPLASDLLLNAIQHAIHSSSAALLQQDAVSALRSRHASLSRRERQVMALVVSGLLNKQTASVLGISEITVKAHRGNVMRKMQADSLPDLVNIAAKLGIAPSGTENRSSSLSMQIA